MADPEVHLGDIGTKLILEVQEDGSALDISSATTMKIRLEKQSGVVVEFTAVFATDGTDGLMQYVTESGDLDEAGVWTIQGFLILATPVGEWTSAKKQFQVKEVLVVTV